MMQQYFNALRHRLPSDICHVTKPKMGIDLINIIFGMKVRQARLEAGLTLSDLARQAELVFVGKVTGIEYRMSEAGPGLVALPHTLVSYRIDRVLKGQAETGDQITLRFQGGPVPGTPNAMIVEGTPTFDTGDRDVLFVRGNGGAVNPVVGWSQGRVRRIPALL